MGYTTTVHLTSKVEFTASGCNTETLTFKDESGRNALKVNEIQPGDLSNGPLEASAKVTVVKFKREYITRGDKFDPHNATKVEDALAEARRNRTAEVRQDIAKLEQSGILILGFEPTEERYVVTGHYH